MELGPPQFGLVGFQEQVEGLLGMRSRVGHPDVVQLLFGRWLQPFGELV